MLSFIEATLQLSFIKDLSNSVQCLAIHGTYNYNVMNLQCLLVKYMDSRGRGLSSRLLSRVGGGAIYLPLAVLRSAPSQETGCAVYVTYLAGRLTRANLN